MRRTLHRCGRGCDGFWRVSFSSSRRGRILIRQSSKVTRAAFPGRRRGSMNVLQPSRRIRLRENLTSSRFRRWICKISSRSDYPYDRRLGMSEQMFNVPVEV